jgi:hypothetical protein
MESSSRARRVSVKPPDAARLAYGGEDGPELAYRFERFSKYGELEMKALEAWIVGSSAGALIGLQFLCSASSRTSQPCELNLRRGGTDDCDFISRPCLRSLEPICFMDSIFKSMPVSISLVNLRATMLCTKSVLTWTPFVDPAANYQVAQELAGSERLVGEQTLRHRLRECGLLASVDTGRCVWQVPLAHFGGLIWSTLSY